MSRHEDLILCDCFSTEHLMIFLYDDDPDWDRVYVHTHLNPNRGFWKRLWQGLKYAFGHRSVYGDFDEMILRPRDHKKLQKVVDILKKIEKRETSKPPSKL